MNIDARELRLNNLVTDEFYDSFKKVIKVESINEKGINLEIENSDDFPEMQSHWIEPYYPFDKLRGIPLSEDWLIKFGFEDRYLRLKHPNRDLKIWISEHGNTFVLGPAVDDDWQFVFETKVEYVHQLQNLYFSLTGEELTIKEQV